MSHSNMYRLELPEGVYMRPAKNISMVGQLPSSPAMCRVTHALGFMILERPDIGGLECLRKNFC